ncbi:MAG: hypothetical protein HQ509_03310 [Candidatus Marinimicrobia bacterium]|nr:hypothetical protein [Candidatus Neomarinimicrobiota bacterium]
MTIDLQNEKGRQDYLLEKMDDLLDGMNDSYGRELLDELISRLETTISDFNDEVKELTDHLKDNSDKKEKLLHNILTHETKGSVSVEENEDVPKAREASEWEKRLESLGK